MPSDETAVDIDHFFAVKRVWSYSNNQTGRMEGDGEKEGFYLFYSNNVTAVSGFVIYFVLYIGQFFW
jgi:hypothetical protein